MQVTKDEAVLLLRKWVEDRAPILVFLPVLTGRQRVAISGRVLDASPTELRIATGAPAVAAHTISLDKCAFAYGDAAQMKGLGFAAIPGAQSYVAIVSPNNALTLIVEMEDEYGNSS